MSEIIIFLIVCSISGIILYEVTINGVLKENKLSHFQEIYWFLHVFVVMFALICIGTVWAVLYLKDHPGTILLTMQNYSWEWLFRLLGLVWMIGVVFYGGVYLLRSGLFWLQRSKASVRDPKMEERALVLAKKLGIRRKPKVLVGKVFLTPQISSGFYPLICMTHLSYSDAQLDGILLHELNHYKRGDIWFRRLCVLLQGVFWFNPVLTRLLEDLDYWDELYCDDRVCRSGLIKRKVYAHILYDINRDLKQGREGDVMRPGFRKNRTNSGLVDRVRLVLSEHPADRIKRPLVASMALAVFLAGSGISVLAGMGLNEVNNWTLTYTSGDIAWIPPMDVEWQEEWDEKLQLGHVICEEERIGLGGRGVIYEALKDASWKSRPLEVKKGETIGIAIAAAEPSSVTVQVGVVAPDGKWYWINDSGTFAYGFEAKKTGTYEIFVRNQRTEPVVITGTYAVYTEE